MNNIPDPNTLYEGPAGASLVVPPYGELTTTSTVRSIFGLSDAELPDEMLTQPVYTDEVYGELARVAPDLEADWPRLSVSTDPKDVRIVRATKQFAAFSYAEQLCDILPLLVARSMTDSKAGFQRFDTDIQVVVANIKQRYAKAENGLISALDDTATKEIVVPAMFGNGRPTYDPVTG